MRSGPLLSGILTGKYKRDGSSDQPGRFGGKISPLLDKNKVHDIVDALREIALAFLLHEKAATSIVFGATKPEQVAANLRASGLTLSPQEIERLDKLSAPTTDYGVSVIAAARTMRQQYLQSA